jgi:hypothetical protein
LPQAGAEGAIAAQSSRRRIRRSAVLAELPF